MGMREWANNHRGAAYGFAGICVLACAGGIVAEVLGNRHTINYAIPDDYFSVDDGKTYFRASASNAPPFTYQGQIAVRAHVFSCDGRPFVGYLERYKPAALKVEQAGGNIPPWVDVSGRELKKPGDTPWVSSDKIKDLAKVLKVTCPDGSGGTPEPIEP